MKSATGVGSGDCFKDWVEEFLVESNDSVDQAADDFCKEFHSRLRLWWSAALNRGSGIRRRVSGFLVVVLVLASLFRVGREWLVVHASEVR